VAWVEPTPYGAGYRIAEGHADALAKILAPSPTPAMRAVVEALRAYKRAGFGNSTDFRLQAEASRMADAALAANEGVGNGCG
jgi:hypothetical protein